MRLRGCRFINVGFLVGVLIGLGGRISAGEQGGVPTDSAISGKEHPAASGEELQRYEFQEKQMGVPCDLILYAPSEEVANGVSRAVYDRISALNRLFSDYEPESEVMRLSRSSGRGEAFRVSDELLEILQESVEMSEASGGAFDVTIGPLVRLWRKSRRLKQLPSQEELATTRESVGYRFVEIDAVGKNVTLTRPKMQLDLGGIAKGYAAQQGIELLRERGIRSALCAMAGDITVSDPPPGKKGWRIGIAPLENGDGVPERFVILKNASISTSGDSQQFIIVDGVRYSHIMDPKTGLGLTTRSSVTAIAPRGSTADALGTMLSVMGPEEGMKLVEGREGCAALIVRKEGAGVREIVSGRFEGYLER